MLSKAIRDRLVLALQLSLPLATEGRSRWHACVVTASSASFGLEEGTDNHGSGSLAYLAFSIRILGYVISTNRASPTGACPAPLSKQPASEGDDLGLCRRRFRTNNPVRPGQSQGIWKGPDETAVNEVPRRQGCARERDAVPVDRRINRQAVAAENRTVDRLDIVAPSEILISRLWTSRVYSFDEWRDGGPLSPRFL